MALMGFSKNKCELKNVHIFSVTLTALWGSVAELANVLLSDLKVPIKNLSKDNILNVVFV
jgi:hypothetical protein